MEKEENDGRTKTYILPMHHPPVPAKKQGGAMSLLRAAMFMVHRRSTSKKPPVHADKFDAGTTTTADVLKSLVGGMRPLHHGLEYHLPPPPPPPPLPAAVITSIPSIVRSDTFHDVPQPPMSPSSSSVDGMSRYASAEDLRLLDVEEVGDNGGGDEAIDMKAEEFIAMFYKQMRLQRLESFNRCNGTN